MSAAKMISGAPPIEAWIEVDGRRISHRFQREGTARLWLVARIVEYPYAECYGLDLKDADNQTEEILFQSEGDRRRLGLADEDEENDDDSDNPEELPLP
jgi:hypothetical protein